MEYANPSAALFATSYMAGSIPGGLIPLYHGLEVRIPGSDPHHRIRVGTCLGYRGEPTSDLSNFAWTTRASGALTDEPAEVKAARAAEERASWTIAPRLTEGMRVWIDGQAFRVHINGVQYSDPVTFRPEALALAG